MMIQYVQTHTYKWVYVHFYTQNTKWDITWNKAHTVVVEEWREEEVVGPVLVP